MKENMDLSFVISGEAGQGLKTVEELICKILLNSKYTVFSSKEYMSRIRGGTNSVTFRVSNMEKKSILYNIDTLFLMSKSCFQNMKERVTKDTLVISDTYRDDFENIYKIETNNITDEKVFKNILFSGLFLSFFDIDLEYSKSLFIEKFKNKEISEKNYRAFLDAYKFGKNKFGKLEINNTSENRKYLNGSEAMAFGAVASKCNFLSSYPMSPGTALMTNLSKLANDFDIVVEQVEDEISAINMAIGASYSGARAIVTTSGGGFALMSEGVSLAGIIEQPVVIHNAQRPGPATGMPTRTEQSDVNLAIFSGHGEFAKAVFAPCDAKDAFYVTNHAFYIAEKYQIPVIILTDQYLLNSNYSYKNFDMSKIKEFDFISKSDENYKRYDKSEGNISKRTVPNYGDGLILVDSHEHDDYGNISEDFENKRLMTEARVNKLDAIVNHDSLSLKLHGNKEDYEYIFVCFGSIYPTLNDAVYNIKEKILIVGFNQLFPINNEFKNIIEKDCKKIIVENNMTSQFGNLLEQQFNFKFDEKILKYNGQTFYCDELESMIKKTIENIRR